MLTRKGSRRATPKSAPPSGGATRAIVENRTCSPAAACGSCDGGTTERSAPNSATLNRTNRLPSRNATMTICAKVSSWSASAATRLAAQATCSTFDTIISRLRCTRSTTAPATKPNTTQGDSRAKPTTPAFAGECVMARTSSGYAMPADSEPIEERTCPAWRRTKSRFLRSGSGRLVKPPARPRPLPRPRVAGSTGTSRRAGRRPSRSRSRSGSRSP